ncbi:MAG: porphobilinogen synthase [Gammaproteobacteria bacterium]|nr:porphobilinogen synthase [Gammaproteobacteria bacterium]
MSSLELRRLRLNSAVRELTREVRVSPEQLIQPYFVVEAIDKRESVDGLPGVYRETPASLLTQIEADIAAGVRKIILFGVPSHKGDDAFDFSFTSQQVAAVKARFGEQIWVAVDVCLCSCTTHGQCGIVNEAGDYLLNDETVVQLVNAALEYAQAGADCVAPSDMMDGRVGAIRNALDAEGFERTVLMSYSAKFESGFYGPFRDAADAAPKGEIKLRDRSTYQIDPARPTDALESSLRDADEGADILMVKPGLPYLDVLSQLSEQIPKPWAVYEVSGEFAAVEVLAERGLIDAPRAHVEAWIAFVRAGASIIITYGARSAQQWLEVYNARS